MTVALIVTGVVAIVIGWYFGKLANTMTSPPSTAMRQIGPLVSAAAGVIFAIVATLAGASAWSFICLPVLGLAVTISMIIAIKNHRI